MLNRVGLDISGINKCSYRLLIKSSVSAFSSYFKRSTLKSPAMRHLDLILDIAESTLTKPIINKSGPSTCQEIVYHKHGV